MQHYYTKNPSLAHDFGIIEFHFRDLSFKFTTDSGVFSKNGVDYGSQVMLKTLPELTGSVLDMGCGYGAIGITLAKLNPSSRISMVDINERAVGLTQGNLITNKIDNGECYQSDAFENIDECFDTIVCNPPIRTGKKVIYPMYEGSYKHLKPNGALYIVIQKKQGANSSFDKLQEIFGNCEVINKDGGYWILKSVKRD